METEKSILTQFIEGGWLMPIIGASGMLARILTTKGKVTIIDLFKKMLTASIASSIAWFLLEQTEVSSLYKAITYGVIGVVSPEIIEGIVKLGKKFASNPTKFIEK
jgi:hypothetical protein